MQQKFNVKRILGGLGVLFLTILTSVSMSSSTSAGVQDFRFNSLDVEYHLSLDEEGRSAMQVKETFVAEFPDFDQNRGIVRLIPLEYQEHPLSLKMGKVYRNGEVASIAKESDNGDFHRLEIRGDEYVHGENTYEINYTLRDVILDPDDANIQEFYWDVNGTGWGQPFGSVSAKLWIDDGLLDRLTGSLACYTGLSGSSARNCTIALDENGVSASTNQALSSGQNLTIAVGFQAGTFKPYQISDEQKILINAVKGLLGLTTIGAVALGVKRISLGNGAKSKKGTSIATQYLPPTGVDVLQSATLLGAAYKAPTAVLIDLAVRHKIKIEEVQRSGLFGVMVKDYKITVIDDKGLTENEQAILASYIKGPVSVGSVREIKRNESSETTALMIQAANKKAYQAMNEAGYYKDPSNKKSLINKSAIIVFTSWVLLMLVFWMIARFRSQEDLSVWSMILVGMSTAIVASFSTMQLKTDRAVEAIDYLKGLKQYIQLAETDRLAFSQSVDMAETIPGATEAERRVVLYERILPYAILFGLEKTWNKVLEVTYQEAGVTPVWYAGTTPFSAGDFSDSLSSFASASSSSSSSSGSSGGGSSGGGGGGGGGGGC